MASRSPTLRASVSDPHEADLERNGLDGDTAEKQHDNKEQKPRKASHQNVDPFGDEEEGDVKYRSLEWWYVYSLRCIFDDLTGIPGNAP